MAEDQDKNNDIDLEKMIADIVSEVFKDFKGIEEEDDDVLETSSVDAESGE